MYFVYVLVSRRDKKLYIGYMDNLKRRIRLHNDGKVESTKHRIPFKLVYYEASKNRKDATRRERYLKTTYGHCYIYNRIKNDL